MGKCKWCGEEQDAPAVGPHVCLPERVFAAGLERAAEEGESVGYWGDDSAGAVEEYVRRIRALIPAAAQTAPPPVAAPQAKTESTCSSCSAPVDLRVEGEVHELRIGSETHEMVQCPRCEAGEPRTPPRSEDQVRAEERWRCVVAIGKMGHGEDKGTIKQAMFRIQELGPDDTAALRAKEQRDQLATSEAFWIEMLDRARCGCFQRDCRVHGAYAAEDVERVEKARGVAKPLEHETMCPCNKEGTLGAAFPHAYCQCAALAKKSEGT